MIVRPSRIAFIPILAIVSATPAQAAITRGELFSNIIYRQTSTTPPSSVLNHFMSFRVTYQDPADFDAISVTFPGPDSRNLNLNGTTALFTSSASFPTLAAMHNTFPFGTYTFTATNTSPPVTQFDVLEYNFDLFTSDIPAVTPATFTAMQTYDSAAAFNLQFNSFTVNPSAASGSTFVSIYQGSNLVFVSSALPHDTTSFLIPADTLLPNKSYKLEIDFTDRLPTLDATHNINNSLGYDVRTDVNFTTAPEPATLALLSLSTSLLLTRRRRSTPPRP